MISRARPLSTPRRSPCRTAYQAVLYARDMGGRRHLVESIARNGWWAYKRLEDTGTLWAAALIPAGLVLPLAFTTHTEAREFTARPDVLDICAANLERQAAAENPNPDRAAAAATDLALVNALRTGALIVGQPTHRCGTCAGMLTQVSGQWRHVAACRPGCWEPASGLPRRICLTPERHTYCGDAYPAECAHDCTNPVDVTGACDRGHDGDCCGCCRPDERGRP